MDTPNMDSHEDTTTTDYDSGESEGVNYAYEGHRRKGSDDLKQITSAKAASPKRKTKSGSPKGKPPSPVRCLCVASQSDEDSTEFEEDHNTDVEDGAEHKLPPPKPRPSGPEGSSTGSGLSREEKEAKKTMSATGKKPSRRRTPYIEEYPEDGRRPLVLLKEHKLPRRFSASDAKQAARESEEQPAAAASSRGRSPPSGKRLPAWQTHQVAQPSKKHSSPPRVKQRRSDVQGQHGGTAHPQVVSRRKHHADLGPAGKFSGSDLGNSESDHEAPAPRLALELSPPRRSSRESRYPTEVVSAVSRSSAWPQQQQQQQPRYASSWPLPTGSHYPQPTTQPRHHNQDGYESEDESDDAMPNPFAQPNPETARHSRRDRTPPSAQRHQHQTHHHQPPPHNHSTRQPSPHRPRPRPSIGAPDRAARRSSPATTVCEIWRGRPEDWESPYASSDASHSDFDDDRPPVLRLLEGSPTRRRRGGSTTRRSVFSVGAGSRRGTEVRVTLGREEGLVLDVSTRRGRAPSVARSRWGGESGYRGFFGGEEEIYEEPEEVEMPLPPPMGGVRGMSPARRWTVECGFPDAPRSRGVSPVFSARRTREFLSPKPTRAARFDFDAWGKEHGSRSALTLPLGLQ
ncbi:hypothetical protein B0T25DRAFT_563495 [Lasiosphaeria hispida]|uniref:Uncharacterized protein n=1 Tax=Lasiosphaeria hispida TaxID=260671 RepID=A0AAJ0HXG3_9PEZI|nr:hypothetical protein B0T25DRAFT_563495 [Lasiosphaeria hispida]